MGFFSKLFGSEQDAQSARNLMNDLFKGNQANQHPQQAQNTVTTTSPQAASQPEEPSPSGFSWGEDMPDEPNQFNYQGSYQQYFEEIFRQVFSDYDVQRTFGKYTNNPIYTFRKNGQTALVVELLSERSASKKLRNDCARSGIPYLRYYYDHDGWWNTRAYVTTRTRNALKF